MQKGNTTERNEYAVAACKLELKTTCLVVSHKVTGILEVLRVNTLMMESVNTSEKSINSCKTTQCNVPILAVMRT